MKKILLLLLVSSEISFCQQPKANPGIVVNDATIQQLNLNKDQQSMILPILNASKADIAKIKTNAALSSAEKVEAIKKIQQTAQSQMAAFLTPAQKASQQTEPETVQILINANKQKAKILNNKELSEEQKKQALENLKVETTRKLQEQKK